MAVRGGVGRDGGGVGYLRRGCGRLGEGAGGGGVPRAHGGGDNSTRDSVPESEREAVRGAGPARWPSRATRIFFKKIPPKRKKILKMPKTIFTV